MPASTHSLARILSFPEGHHSLIVTSRHFRAERRSKFRFPLDLCVRFRPLAGSLFSGAGRAINVSSGGVLVSQHVVSQCEISVGALVEMSIEWPSLLDGRVPLQLFAVGRIVRRRASHFAAAFERYQFRTLKRSILPNLDLE
jgi:PilZ domain